MDRLFLIDVRAQVVNSSKQDRIHTVHFNKYLTAPQLTKDFIDKSLEEWAKTLKDLKVQIPVTWMHQITGTKPEDHTLIVISVSIANIMELGVARGEEDC